MRRALAVALAACCTCQHHGNSGQALAFAPAVFTQQHRRAWSRQHTQSRQRCSRLTLVRTRAAGGGGGVDQQGLEKARAAALAEDREWFLQFIGDPGDDTSPPQQQDASDGERDYYYDEDDGDDGDDGDDVLMGQEFRVEGVGERAAAVRATRGSRSKEGNWRDEAAEAEPWGSGDVNGASTGAAAAAIGLTEEQLEGLVALGYDESDARALTDDMALLVLERKVSF
jgi:hypothetical protein